MDTLMQSEKITELAKAMLLVQESLKPAAKDAHNNFTQSTYATLGSVMGTCHSALLDNDLWLTQYPVPASAGHLGLVTKIVHAPSGQWQASLLTMPLPKNDPQGYGSAITYARRYGISALVGIVTEQDDDANRACRPETQPHASPPRQVQRQANERQYHRRATSPATNLPTLNGVQYRRNTTANGTPCVFATGNTLNNKEHLRKAGFRWDGTRQVWWRQMNAA